MSENKKADMPHVQMLAQIPLVNSIFDVPGTETLEGRVGAIVNGNKGAAHYIEMPPNMYCGAHKHPTESIIYTAKGKWVLCSEGQRHLMEEGSLYFMPPDVETGYEVPFDKPATILIVKFEGPNDPEAFHTRIQNMKAKLEQRKSEGTPFSFSELSADHPANVFAKAAKT